MSTMSHVATPCDVHSDQFDFDPFQISLTNSKVLDVLEKERTKPDTANSAVSAVENRVIISSYFEFSVFFSGIWK